MENLYDVLIIGAGPSGLTAGIYSGRANLKVGIIERGIAGGQLANTEEIENYPSYENIKGKELADKLLAHAKECGAEYMYGDVREITKGEDNLFTIKLAKKELVTKTVILGMGTQHLKLGVEGEEELSGRGVSYCAVCDGAFFKDKDLVVVGGGDSAVEEAMYLTQYATNVKLLVRGDKLKAQPTLVNRLVKNEKIEVIYNTSVTEINGTGEGFAKKVSSVSTVNNVTGATGEIETNGVFIYVGMKPNSQIVEGLVELDAQGYIVTNAKMETSVEGIYAMGDIRTTPLRQVISACGDGSIAGQQVYNYIQENNL